MKDEWMHEHGFPICCDDIDRKVVFQTLTSNERALTITTIIVMESLLLPIIMMMTKIRNNKMIIDIDID
jgi:hypothetical protein